MTDAPAPGPSAAAALLGGLPCGALMLDEQHRIAQANAALESMTGWTTQRLLGLPFESLFTPAAGAMFQSYVLPMLALHGRIDEFALSIRTASGQPADVLIYAQNVVHDGGPRVVALLAPYQTRKAVDDELLKVKRAADQSPSMIFELVRQADGRLCFTYLSQSVRTLYGCSPQQARTDARRVLDQLPARAVEQFATEPGEIVEKALQLEWQVREGRSDAAWHQWNAVPRRSADGRVFWAGQVADVTALRALHDEAVNLRAAAKARQAQQQFLGRVSHELRTPLNAILGFTELLSTTPPGGDEAVNRRYVDLIASAGRRLLGLVDDILDLSSVRSNAFDSQSAAVQLAPLVDDSVAMLGPQAMRADVRLSAEVPDDLWVLSDAARLTQVLDNLVSNAIKYNRRGGSVQVVAAARDGGIALDVRDSGIGLDDAQRQALFQPFNRLGAERRGIAGTGLGLVIAAQIVDAMGGRLQVDSTPEVGSCFSIWLPACEPPGATDGLPADDAPADDGAASHGVVPRHVLYVEDDPVSALLLQTLAADLPWLRVTVAASGQEALLQARASAPDLLLCDRFLPDLDGPKLLARLRSSPGLGALPAIMVSGDASEDAREAAQAAGFSEVWTKPLDVAATRRRLADRWRTA